VGQILGVDHMAADINVYSMHARRQRASNDLIHLDRFGFGDSAVLFKNFDEFVKRVKTAANREGIR
jgi:hypothetical protein